MHTRGGERKLFTRDKSQSHAKPGEGRIGMSPYPLTTLCLAATSISTANNRHLLNTNCVHLPWHKKSESMYPWAPVYNSAFSHRGPGHETMLGIIVLSKFAIAVSYPQLSSRAEASKLFSIKVQIVNTSVHQPCRFLCNHSALT